MKMKQTKKVETAANLKQQHAASKVTTATTLRINKLIGTRVARSKKAESSSSMATKILGKATVQSLTKIARSATTKPSKPVYKRRTTPESPPTKKEISIAGKLLVARKGNEKEMLQDMWWAILNSNEFIMQH